MEYLSAGASPYDCPPDACVCDAPVLTITVQDSPVLIHCTWTGTLGNQFQWYLYEQTTTGSVLVTSGLTTDMFKDFGSTDIVINKVYFFSVYQLCGDCISSVDTAFFSLPPEPIVIVTDPDEPTLIHYHAYLRQNGGTPPGTVGWGNAAKLLLTVNGTLLSSTMPMFGSQWWLTGGSLTSATIKIEVVTSGGAPATGPVGVPLLPHVMYTTALLPVPGVISGANNHIVTWTGVNITPSFLSYVHLYLY